MLIEVSKEEYRKHFSTDSSPFITEQFVELVENKQDKILRLMKDDNPSIGLLAGIKDGIMRSPFSAPFGGFHYKYEHMLLRVVYVFISELKDYISKNGLKQLYITLPPNLYQASMNAKLVNAFISLGFTMETPDINNWINLKEFNGEWVKSVVLQNYRKAMKHGLTWCEVSCRSEMEEAYRVIRRNREEKGRDIYMTLDDLLKVKEIFPVEFFIIRDKNAKCVGAGIFYRGHENIVQCIFLGDDMENRSLGVMNLMYINCYNYYKKLGFDYIDMGASSLRGEPNSGLIRFKELHNCVTSLRYTFTWKS
ncbi:MULTISPECIES: hypothetical protein [unclassified Proteiniphilum]|jgi:hypothetical protein|uniref:hypothetical protein n=1 Tax=unclassified Proteiniphilum TaxID=2622718 RepID=UPI00257B61C6|nr:MULTISPECIES: hypothetical protein [unclassified Proteiniphilum]